MAFLDYYKVLGIDKSASQDDVKKAYRKLARKHHPDLNPEDEDAKKRFQEINEANEVLTDPEKRKKFDQYGENWKHSDAYEKTQQQYGSAHSRDQSYGNPFEGYDFNYSGNYDTGEYSDFFEQMFGSRFGGGSQRSSAYRGQDFQATLELTLRQAATTHQQTFLVNGKNIRITVPAGVSDGQKVRLKGQGSEGRNGGPRGDLYITFNIKPDSNFLRKGDDLNTLVEIDAFTAMLGGDSFAETLDGKLRVKIKEGTQSGSKIRLKGKGFPKYKKEGEFGDLYAEIKIVVPTGLSDEEKETIRQLSDKIKSK